MTTNEAQVADLTKKATAALRRADRSEGAERSRHLRRTADLLVDLRALHANTEGETDWRGTSYPYRALVASIYSGAGLPQESGHKTKTALRYHIGSALRERLSDEDLKAAGLGNLDPRERQQARRAEVGDAVPQGADRIIAHVNYAVRRLQHSRPGRLSAHDIARAEDAHERLGEWLHAWRKAHPEQ